MTIDPRYEMAGVPILRVRDMLRRFDDDITPQLIASLLEIPPKGATAVHAELVSRGYLGKAQKRWP